MWCRMPALIRSDCRTSYVDAELNAVVSCLAGVDASI